MIIDIKKFNSDPLSYIESTEYIFLKEFFQDSDPEVAMLVYNVNAAKAGIRQIYSKGHLYALPYSKGLVSLSLAINPKLPNYRQLGLGERCSLLTAIKKSGYDKMRLSYRQVAAQEFKEDFAVIRDNKPHVAAYYNSCFSWLCYYFNIISKEEHTQNLNLENVPKWDCSLDLNEKTGELEADSLKIGLVKRLQNRIADFDYYKFAVSRAVKKYNAT